MSEHEKKLRWGLSRNQWLIVAGMFLINASRSVMRFMMSPFRDPFKFALDIAVTFVASHVTVRALSVVWGRLRGTTDEKEAGEMKKQ